MTEEKKVLGYGETLVNLRHYAEEEELAMAIDLILEHLGLDVARQNQRDGARFYRLVPRGSR